MPWHETLGLSHQHFEPTAMTPSESLRLRSDSQCSRSHHHRRKTTLGQPRHHLLPRLRGHGLGNYLLVEPD